MPPSSPALNLSSKRRHLLKVPAHMSKPQILHGVPYTVNNLSQALAYQPGASPLLFGTVAESKTTLQLASDWRTTAQPFLEAYRESLRLKTVEKLALASRFAPH